MNRARRTMAPKSVALFELITGMWTAQAISVTAYLGVADHMGKEPTDADELARKVGAKPETLYRLLRALTNEGIFDELPGKRFRLTPLGECLRADSPNSVKAMAIFEGQFQWRHWGDLLHSIKTGETAVEKANGGKCMFEVLKEQPEMQKHFDTFMGNISVMEVDAILAAYAFDFDGTVADIGGGTGYVLNAVLASNPRLSGILYDQPQVLKNALATLKKSGRCKLIPGNFFSSVPEGARVYIMKHIIHDWDEEECARILGNIRKVIPADGKLLLMETVITRPGVPHFSKLLDLEMLVAAGGQERTAEEYGELLKKAGFRMNKVVPTAGLTSVIEAQPV